AVIAAAAARAGGGRSGDRRRRHAELLLERLDALGELEHGDRLELLDPILGAGCHVFLVLLGLSGSFFGRSFLRRRLWFGRSLGGRRVGLRLRLRGRRLGLGLSGWLGRSLGR